MNIEYIAILFMPYLPLFLTSAVVLLSFFFNKTIKE